MISAAQTLTCRHTRLRIATLQASQFIDVTDRIAALVEGAAVQTGFVNVQVLHTTAAIVVNEHEPLLLADFLAQLERTAPVTAHYRHDDLRVRTVNLVPDERRNGHAHCQALQLSASAILNVAGGRLQLGRWQRVFLLELDGPQTRDLSVLVAGECDR